jgi:hypothetical protein
VAVDLVLAYNMKLFTDTFKLYAYKNRDRCDLSIRLNDSMVMTFKLTHEEFRKIITEYTTNDPANDRYGVQFTSQAGQFWFVMNKQHFQAVRITIGNHGVDFNFRINYTDWDLLKVEYENQMSNIMPWD